MKLKKLLASVLSFATMVTTVAPATNVMNVFAADSEPIVLTVGQDDGEYKTINEALDKIKNGEVAIPTQESERVYINVDPGVYEEQVIFESSMKYITIRQTPNTEGLVRLSWYYCTGYAYSNVGVDGRYDPNVDWSHPGTWYGYNDVDENGNVIAETQEDFTKYEIGQKVDGATISYYDKNNEKQTKKTRTYLGGSFQLDGMAALVVQNGATDIVVEDLHIVNSVPVMVTQGEKDAHITPEANPDSKWLKPTRDNLSICDEDVEEIPVSSIDQTTPYNAGQSAYVVRSYNYNERGHAISINGDRTILKNVYARGNQDSVYISSGRVYFEDCNLIGGTDYIYGNAAAVFNNCKLGWEGMSDRDYGGPITAANTDIDNPYGYLFYNCELYSVRANTSSFYYGRPWGSDAQVTYYNSIIDDNATTGKAPAKITDTGWGSMSVGADEARHYEYGTRNKSDGSLVDTSKRVVNTRYGMGTVLDDWQVLEFNPRNYFKARSFSAGKIVFAEDWDPMGFASKLSRVDAQIKDLAIDVPAGNETTVTLPTSTDEKVEFKYVSASANAVVSENGKTIEVIRPAYGEDPITTTVTLYAKDTEYVTGDKKEIQITINPTTDTTNTCTVPVTVSQSTTAETNCDYTVTITKEGALIKEQVVTVPAGKTTITTNIENLPASEAGIDYDVKVVSSSDEFTVVNPDSGLTTLKAVKGQTVPLSIVSQKIVDESVALTDTIAEGSGFTVLDLYDLAKANGADSSIESSDIISFEYDLNVSAALSGQASYMLLTPNKPSKIGTGADATRFLLYRIYTGWTQLDIVDGASGFSGVSDTESQNLNVGGKFDYSTPTKVKNTINYKTKTITTETVGSNTKTKTFTYASFPTDCSRDSLYFATDLSTSKTASVSNMKVTYKKVVSDAGSTDPVEPEQPKDTKITNVAVSNGNTVVTLEGPTGVVVAVKYDGSKTTALKTADATSETVTINGIEADAVYVWNSLAGMQPLCNSYVINPRKEETTESTTEKVESSTETTTENQGGSDSDTDVEAKAFDVDFTSLASVPVYSESAGQGFVSQSGHISPVGYERKVAEASQISLSADGASITETNGSYLKAKVNDDYNYGGLIYRVDTGAPGAYHLEVEVLDASNTIVAPTGTDGGRLTGSSPWDTAGLVPRTTYAKWEGNVWSFDFATGEDFVEIEIEPNACATADKPQTVGVKSIKVTPLAKNPKGDKPTIHILGDSTQKTYTFVSPISSWGQTLVDYFNSDKVNVINYSMGGRAMRSNYAEGRSNDVFVNGKEGDFVFIHSAHNDETVSTDRFTRGASYIKDDLAANNEMYNQWLDMFCKGIKARGMTPVLVTAMPRTGAGKYSESDNKPNGFNPDSPGNMRAKAASDSEVGLVELYAGAKEYIDSVDAAEINGIYNSVEAGETPAQDCANGNTGDGTHYRESAGRQWCRIMLQSMYDQSVATTDTYKDKDIMTELVSYMTDDVQDAAKTKDWSKVFPEMAIDVSAVGIVPGATKQASDNYYYRNVIEKVLQLGFMKKDSSNKFYPTAEMTVGEFARGVEKAFGLKENSLTSYTKTAEELGTSTALSSVVDLVSDVKEVADNAVSVASVEPNVQLADGEVTVTVSQPTGGTVTVYNESVYKTSTCDIPAGVTASQVLLDDECMKVTAPAAIGGNKTDKNGVFDNSAISINYYEAKTSDGEITTIEAKANGTLTAYIAFVDSKIILLENKTDKIKQEKYINGEKGEDRQTNYYKPIEFEVEAGKTYELSTNGGNGKLFGLMFATDYPSSTESLVVSSGDTVKVVAQRADNTWIFDSILVDGKAVSTEREYKFTVTGNTTVSANFIENPEPKLVETTVIASDAKLTREAMGAILYDAYLIKFGKDSEGNWNKPGYMTKYNGTILPPDDPNYDPNIVQTGTTQYYNITGWSALEDVNDCDDALYAKVKEVYNLGLMRTNDGLKRAAISSGSTIAPKEAVTRAKAAKALAFIYILTQPENAESQVLPNGNLAADTAELVTPNENALSVPVVTEN